MENVTFLTKAQTSGLSEEGITGSSTEKSPFDGQKLEECDVEGGGAF